MSFSQYPEKYYSRIEKKAEKEDIFQNPERFVQKRQKSYERNEEDDLIATIFYTRHGESEYREVTDDEFNANLDIDLTDKGIRQAHESAEHILKELDQLNLKDESELHLLTSPKARAKSFEKLLREDFEANHLNIKEGSQKTYKSAGGVKTYHKPEKEIYEEMSLFTDDIDKFWRSGKFHEKKPDNRDIETPEELQNRILKAFVQTVSILRDRKNKGKIDNTSEVIVAVGHDEVLGALLSKFNLKSFEKNEGRLGYGDTAELFVLDEKVILEYGDNKYEFDI
jgi:broad specificity phosphatase PhoE